MSENAAAKRETLYIYKTFKFERVGNIGFVINWSDPPMCMTTVCYENFTNALHEWAWRINYYETTSQIKG